MVLKTPTDTTRISLPAPAAWQTPIPLEEIKGGEHPYPLDALPPLIGEAVAAYQPYGQQPLPLIACSALANVSLACQGLANVARDRLLVSPVSLYFLVIAGSGERKSAADRLFGAGVRQWERAIHEKMAPAVHAAKTLHDAWYIEKEAILTQIRRAALLGIDTSDLKQLYAHALRQEPIIPLVPHLFFEDVTQEALAWQLAHGWPCASLWSDEGGLVLSSQSMQNSTTKFVALLNRLWDGQTFTAHRKTSPSFTLSHRRLTVSIMLQPLILQQLLARSDGISRQSGFLARSLMAAPLSAMGNRYYQEPPEALSAVACFQERLKACLNQSLKLDRKGCHSLPTLTFSTKAKAVWVSFFNETETGLGESRRWSAIRDFASKAAENAARLAALFHLCEGHSQTIAVEAVERAQDIIRWHLAETHRLLVEPQAVFEQNDAQTLLTWLMEKAIPHITPRELLQYSPLRDKGRRDAAIDILIQHHCVQVGKCQGKTRVWVNPILF
jgi:hypothetical protein